MKILLPILFTVLFLIPPLVLATSDDNTTTTSSPKPAAAKAQEIRQGIRSKVAENHANRLEKRFTAYIKHFENIISRLQARLDTLTAAGKDVTNPQSKLEAVKTKLAEAKAKGEEAVAAFRAIDPAKFSEQKPQLLAARDLANTARRLFKETHALLKETFKALKTISQPALPAASPAV